MSSHSLSCNDVDISEFERVLHPIQVAVGSRLHQLVLAMHAHELPHNLVWPRRSCASDRIIPLTDWHAASVQCLMICIWESVSVVLSVQINLHSYPSMFQCFRLLTLAITQRPTRRDEAYFCHFFRTSSWMKLKSLDFVYKERAEYEHALTGIQMDEVALAEARVEKSKEAVEVHMIPDLANIVAGYLKD